MLLVVQPVEQVDDGGQADADLSNAPKCIGKGVNGCLKKAPRPWGVHIKGSSQ
ncbi:hypothetical protein MRY70_17195 [Pseudomonas sp. M1]|uniref:hypothetical protein n=1 Tax=Pseudomonas sp. (strain M1) TaxID=95619 RepID=UPI001FA7061E|nr:hypothetical protein [Pseudomonas sp. M1]UNY92360.1 hypothetical protein MRY70_17195 [Pseudomonas sp. M1]